MPTDLSLHIQQLALTDTHEHLGREPEWLERGPTDVLQDLFGNYVGADLIAAGAAPAAVQRLMDGTDPDLPARFAGVRAAWEAIRFTGYGEAVRVLAQQVYGLDELVPEALAPAQARLALLRQPGERLRLLRTVANLDHTQTDDFRWECVPDESGPEFFLYDLSWWSFCAGTVDWSQLAEMTGITVVSLPTLREAMAAIFAKHAACAVAVKAQHAYNRTLRWEERSDADAERALRRVLADPEGVDEPTRLCLADWCWARGVELAIQHNLPFKIHTGYYAGHGRMPVDRIRAGHLCGLLARYPEARFVLMHIAYPYSGELVALVKHYPNAWADLCWAWSINPRASSEFVRTFLHAAPANKLFAFGGDTRWPTSALAYAFQARRWLTRALEAEVADGSLSETEAMGLATRLMRDNQRACFDLEGTRTAIKTAMPDGDQAGR
jgi:predicted TIM-barrel fold metal-dependent hydrolase